MNATPEPASTTPPPPPPPTFLRRFLAALWIKRLPVLAFVLGVAGLSVVSALLSQPWYTAQATLLPPSESGDPLSNLAGLIESSTLSRVGLFSTSSPSDIHVEILKSRRLRESLARRFDLPARYEIEKMDDVLKELDSHYFVKAEPSGIVVVRIEDTDRARCAEMTNFIVQELDRFNRETLNTRGKGLRQFLEKRLADVERRMYAAESTLTRYEQANKVVVAASDASIRGFSDIMARKLALQVRRAYVQSYSSPESPDVREIDAEISAFERELGRLPVLKNEGARLALEAQIHGKLFTFLTTQYEQARVEEMRDTPTVTVLDPARPPDHKTRPKRTLMVLGSTFAASLVAAAWVGWPLRKPALA